MLLKTKGSVTRYQDPRTTVPTSIKDATNGVDCAVALPITEVGKHVSQTGKIAIYPVRIFASGLVDVHAVGVTGIIATITIDAG